MANADTNKLMKSTKQQMEFIKFEARSTEGKYQGKYADGWFGGLEERWPKTARVTAQLVVPMVQSAASSTGERSILVRSKYHRMIEPLKN